MVKSLVAKKRIYSKLPLRAVLVSSKFLACANVHCLRNFKDNKGLNNHYTANPMCHEANKGLPFFQARHTAFFEKLPTETDLAAHDDDEEESVDPMLGDDDSHTGSISTESEEDSSSESEEELPAVVEPTFIRPNVDAFTAEQFVETELLKLCMDVSAPFSFYKQILEWAQRAKESGYTFVPQYKTRRSLTRHLTKWLRLEHFVPKQQAVILPGDGLEIDVTIFNFTDGLTTLLNHPELTGDITKLDVDPDNPFGRYPKHWKTLSCVNSGSWYQDTYDRKVTNPDKQLLLPIIFACDETTLTMTGKASCWPLLFTTTLFSQELRNQPLAWYPLGYVYDISAVQPSSLSSSNKHLKYSRLHAIFRAILYTFVEAQAKDALNNCPVTFGQQTKIVDILIECSYIIGDMQGGDKLCATPACYSNKMARLCRACDVSGADSGRADVVCKRIVQEDIMDMLRNNEHAKLDAINQYHVNNAWFEVSFGGDKHGIFSAACPVEALHALENGLISDANKIFMQNLKPAHKKQLDHLISQMSLYDKQYYYTSGTVVDMPRVVFKDGISNLSEITAATQVGVMFTIVVFSLIKTGRNYLQVTVDKGGNEVSKMREAFQMLLCYWMWLKKPEYWERGDAVAKANALRAVRTMLHRILMLYPREVGQGWMKPKFHEQLHVIDDIDRNGAHRNYHSGPTEHNHIRHVKKPARNAQKVRATLDKQIGMRTKERHVVDCSYGVMASRNAKKKATQDLEFMGFTKQCSKGQFVFTGPPEARDGSFHWTTGTDYGAVQENLFRAVGKFACADMDTREDHGTIRVNLYTEYKRKGVGFRAHPSYRGNKAQYDWVMVRWIRHETVRRRNASNRHDVDVAYNDTDGSGETYDFAPAKILGFVEWEGEPAVVVETCSIHYERGSVFTTEWEQEIDPDTKMAHTEIITPDSIVRHCLMIPDDEGDSSSTKYHEFWERDRWADEFHKC